jgi:cysteine desulfurase family protein
VTDRIYLDNAATSWPKPPAVYEIVDRYQRQIGAPAGRSAYREANDVERLIEDARRRVAQWFNAESPQRIVFTCNGTDALNLALQGMLRPGDHVVTSVAEHNSVLRPLQQLADHREVQVTRVGCDAQGLIDPDRIRTALRRETRMIVLVHASNVTGALQPVADVGRIARERGLIFLVDAAQSAGHVPVDVRQMGAHLLAAPGHKGLLGPLGTGVLYVAPDLERQLVPLRCGGTGTDSLLPHQPNSMPERYEAGNHNVPGILGLGAGVAYLQQRTIQSIGEHDQQLTRLLLDGLSAIDGVTVLGPHDVRQRVGVVSVAVQGFEPQEVAMLLDSACGVQVRAGLHCAPLMHQALGTLEQGGAVRFSLGHFNTAQHVQQAVEALSQLVAGAAG